MTDMTATEFEFTPAVWVGCLACYNDGNLVGDWVGAFEAGDFIPCNQPGHEERQAMDHEGFLGALDGETSPEEAQDLAERMRDELSDMDSKKVAAWIEHSHNTGDDFMECVESFQDSYDGTFDTRLDWAWGYMDNTGMLNELPHWVNQSAVVEAWLNDVEHSGDVYFYRTQYGVAAVHAY